MSIRGYVSDLQLEIVYYSRLRDGGHQVSLDGELYHVTATAAVDRPGVRGRRRWAVRPVGGQQDMTLVQSG